jgi:hypothetical protein
MLKLENVYKKSKELFYNEEVFAGLNCFENMACTKKGIH